MCLDVCAYVSTHVRCWVLVYECCLLKQRIQCLCIYKYLFSRDIQNNVLVVRNGIPMNTKRLTTTIKNLFFNINEDRFG